MLMKAKRMLGALIALWFTVCSALCEPVLPDAWISEYNEHAEKISAQTLSADMLAGIDGSGLYTFELPDLSVLCLSVDKGLQLQGIMYETHAGDAEARGIFACALAASTENVTVESAIKAFDKALGLYQKDTDGEYAFLEFDAWMLIFYRGYDDGESRIFTALTLDAYNKITGEEEKPAASENTPDSSEAQPDEKKDDQPTSPENGKTQGEGIIHKL